MAAKRSNREAQPDFEYFAFQEHSGSGNVPAFLSKLWMLVEDPSNNEIICWDSQGASFHIYDQSRFAAEVLPYYFKHNNISSFIRQLNMYGFRKVPNVEQGGLKVERDDVEFQHPFFVRGHEELLDRIKRKTGQTRTEQRPVTLDPENLSKVLSEVAQIKSKQDTFNTTMEDLKRENQILWREVIKLTKKYQQQQHIISKIMHFLLSLVNKHGRGMPGLSRKRPLMINAPQPSSSSEAPPAKKANIVLTDARDHDYTVQSPADTQSPAVSTNTSGVVIQELLDHFDPSLPSPSPQMSGSLSSVNEVPAVPRSDAQSPPISFLTSTSTALNPTTTVSQVLFPQSQSSTPVILPTQVTVPVVSLQQQQQQTPGQPVSSQQIALRGVTDKPLSASSTAVPPKLNCYHDDARTEKHVQVLTTSCDRELTEQISRLQCDIDNVRDVLSSGQFNLDPSFIMGLFDPETPLPVNIDSSLIDILPPEGIGADLQTAPAPAQLPAAAPETINGNELSQFQPADLHLPSLFDELDTGVPTEDTDDNLPLFFENDDSSSLNTPTVVKSAPNLLDSDITLEDVD